MKTETQKRRHFFRMIDYFVKKWKCEWKKDHFFTIDLLQDLGLECWLRDEPESKYMLELKHQLNYYNKHNCFDLASDMVLTPKRRKRKVK